MRQKFELRVIIGALIWLSVIAGTVLYMNRGAENQSPIPSQMVQYFGQQRRTIELKSRYLEVFGIGDPVFLEADDDVQPIGVISSLDIPDSYTSSSSQKNFKKAYLRKATVTLYGGAPEIVEGDYVMHHTTDESMAWIIRTMFPPHMKEKIGGLILSAYKTNQSDLMQVFRPVVEQSLVDATTILREDLKQAIENHRVEIDGISARFQSDLLEDEILPLVQDEIWPIVQQEARPLTSQVGQEIWQEVSVWRFGWRYLYDRSPLPEKKLAAKEFDRFVDNKAVPILQNHLEDFIELQQTLLSKISQNPKVRTTVSAAIREIAEDPEVQALMTKIFKEIVIDNDRLKKSLEANWNSAQAKRALSLANDRLEPTIRQIGETIFGSPETQITPEFARILRNRVMHKDERWFTLHTKASGNRDEVIALRLIVDAKESARNGTTEEEQHGVQSVPMVVSDELKDIPDFAPELEQ